MGKDSEDSTGVQRACKQENNWYFFPWCRGRIAVGKFIYVEFGASELEHDFGRIRNSEFRTSADVEEATHLRSSLPITTNAALPTHAADLSPVSSLLLHPTAPATLTTPHHALLQRAAARAVQLANLRRHRTPLVPSSPHRRARSSHSCNTPLLFHSSSKGASRTNEDESRPLGLRNIAAQGNAFLSLSLLGTSRPPSERWSWQRAG